MKVDVAVVGGGPGGSTVGAFLCRYKPGMKVAIFERETFPRDHVGESQLPAIGQILHELGVWDKVEGAGFPVKIGGTYRWGNTDDLWDFHFLPNGDFHEAQRPAKWEGQRRETALQVDRAIYDKILLDHARELGCEVYEAHAIRNVERDGDRIKSLGVEGPNGALETVEARHYIDASGHSGFLRRAMGVAIEEPSALRNIAVWDYWQNAEWAVSIGVGGTRIQVMSVGYGWLWFIPLSATRTSIGFVCPADYYKKSGHDPETLYLNAIADEPRIRSLVHHATREGKLSTTKDWSFVAERLTGENWMLVGEAAGFADPILSAGLTLTHTSAREAAFTILEMERGRAKKWLLEEYEQRNRRRVLQHIRFADYWYTGNGCFDDLREYTREIARDAGLELNAEKAFQWLGTGGFIEEDMGLGGLGTVSFSGLHQIVNRFTRADSSTNALEGYSGFVLDLTGAKKIEIAHYENGRVEAVPAYRRDGKLLPLGGLVGLVVKGLQHSPRASQILAAVAHELAGMGVKYNKQTHDGALEALEAMVRDGWVTPKKYKFEPALTNLISDDSSFIGANKDHQLPEERRAKALT